LQVVDFYNEMSDLKVCEISDPASDMPDQVFKEQAVNSYTHDAYIHSMTDCPTSDPTITYMPVQSDLSALPSWLTYDSDTRTFTSDSVQTATSVDILMQATTDGLLSADTEQAFSWTLVLHNYAPEMRMEDVSVFAYTGEQFTPTVTDADAGEVFSFAATYADLTTLDPLLFDLDTATGALTVHPLDNTYAATYSLTLTVTDSDADGTGLI